MNYSTYLLSYLLCKFVISLILTLPITSIRTDDSSENFFPERHMIDIGFARKHYISHVTDIRFARKHNIYHVISFYLHHGDPFKLRPDLPRGRVKNTNLI